jgi:chemotaxis protein MotB
MADKEGPAPIIVKRVKKVVGGHHGGSWKVAYADFVTAMMAFFLLMWLLNATSARTISGLAEYFAPTIGVKDKMGIGFKGGQGQVLEGRAKETDTNKGLIFGAPKLGTVVNDPRVREEVDQTVRERIDVVTDEGHGQDQKSYDQVKAEVADKIKNNPDFVALQEAVELKQTSEGLMIQLLNKKGSPMFEEGSATLTPYAEKLLGQVSKIISLVPNKLSIEGHTSNRESKDTTKSNWDLSVGRANNARLYLTQMGVSKEQVSKVVGRADRDPYNPQAPGATENNRVSIILLKTETDPFHRKPSPDAIFIDPDAAEKEKFLSVDPLKKVQEEKKKAEEMKQKEEEKRKQEEIKRKKEIWNPKEFKGDPTGGGDQNFTPLSN